MNSLGLASSDYFSMDLDTVNGLVIALAFTYQEGLEIYTRWQRRNRLANNYDGHGEAGQSGGSCCGLSTSLSFSAPRIREAFDSGANLLGDGFSIGDGKETCAIST
jgi:hypothetical protein